MLSPRIWQRARGTLTRRRPMHQHERGLRRTCSASRPAGGPGRAAPPPLLRLRPRRQPYLLQAPARQRRVAETGAQWRPPLPLFRARLASAAEAAGACTAAAAALRPPAELASARTQHAQWLATGAAGGASSRWAAGLPVRSSVAACTVQSSGGDGVAFFRRLSQPRRRPRRRGSPNPSAARAAGRNRPAERRRKWDQSKEVDDFIRFANKISKHRAGSGMNAG
jgi:hypothetical protein